MDSGAPDPALGVAGSVAARAFRALMLSPRRVGDPASARAFARPYRDVTERLRRWERQGHLRHDDVTGALPPRVHRRRAHGPRPGRRARRLAAHHGPRRARGAAPRGASSRSRAPSSPTAWSRWASTPPRSCWCTAARPRCAPWSTTSSATSRGRSSPTAASAATGSGPSATPTGCAPSPSTSPTAGRCWPTGTTATPRTCSCSGAAGHRRRPRPGDAGRPGRHPAVPRARSTAP